jgi:hypothetical protein
MYAAGTIPEMSAGTPEALLQSQGLPLPPPPVDTVARAWSRAFLPVRPHGRTGSGHGGSDESAATGHGVRMRPRTTATPAPEGTAQARPRHAGRNMCGGDGRKDTLIEGKKLPCRDPGREASADGVPSRRTEQGGSAWKVGMDADAVPEGSLTSAQGKSADHCIGSRGGAGFVDADSSMP